MNFKALNEWKSVKQFQMHSSELHIVVVNKNLIHNNNDFFSTGPPESGDLGYVTT